ncbi:hypothetical protein Sme01_19570 [Sphaerisporangium melleum]|uniref:Uncharacterized protein n=1 Tax=Sphaerisporangium melleum TaxID=321316 RepID=A0A917REY4_9ACTN|nr:hypothetical protein GCM10007964_51060 [Sphaerisporangium melleum]GII69481.1 hypothetical protein Sme01_19570 [Sphaerisporangium melleum]
MPVGRPGSASSRAAWAAAPDRPPPGRRPTGRAPYAIPGTLPPSGVSASEPSEIAARALPWPDREWHSADRPRVDVMSRNFWCAPGI